jgi:hypothetical protein
LKKGKKILKRVLIALGVLLLVILLDVLFWLGPTVKLLAEWIGPKALGTPVTIEALSINPRKGTVLMSGFAIANQASYGNSNAVEIAHLDIAVDMGSLFSPTVTVERIRIDSPHLVFEQSEASDNIAEFIQSALDFAGYDPDAPPEEEKEKDRNSDKEPKAVMVDSVHINDAQVQIAHTHDPDLDIGLRIGRFTASMTNGVFQLRDLEIANPNRLSTRTLFSLERIDLLIDPLTFHTAPFTILDLQVHKPHGFVEWAEDASTVSELLNIASGTGDRISAWPIPEDPEQAAAESEPAPPPELRKAAVTDLQFHLVNSVDPLLSIQAGVEQLDADLQDGSVNVGRIYISNPRRLALPDLFSLDGIEIRLDPGSLYAPPLSIKDIQVRRPYVFLEANKETDTVSELMKIADTITGSLPAQAEAAAAPKPAVPVKPDASAPPPLELHNLAVDDIQLKLLDSTSTNAPAEPIMLAGIGSISGAPAEGNIQIEDLRIPNPAGFHATNLYHLALIRIALDPASLFSEQIMIKEILVDSPRFNLEQTETTGNVAELQKSLLHFVPSGPDAGEAAAPEDPAGDPVPLADQPVLVQSLLVTNFAVSAILPPPAAATNEPASDRTGRLRLKSLNPMARPGKGNTNGIPDIQSGEIVLLAFDLLRVEPLKGSIGISNLKVGNPQGFVNRYLVGFEQFSLQFDPDTVTSDTLVIKRIQIDRPGVSYERKVMTDNIKAFQETIEGAMTRSGNAAEKAEEPQAEEEGDAKKVIIEHLLVQNGMVKAKVSALPTATIPLPTIEQRDIGKEEGGATLTEASTRVFTIFYDAIIGVVANTTGIAGDALKGAGAFTFDALDNVTGGLEGLMGKDGNAVSDEAEEKEPEKKKKKNRSPFRLRRFHK